VKFSLLSLCKRAFVCVKTARLCVYVCVALFFSLFIMWKSLLFVVAAFHFFRSRARRCPVNVLQKTKRGIDFTRLVEERVTFRSRIANPLVTGSRCRGGTVNI
jgi:hypothetical protein